MRTIYARQELPPVDVDGLVPDSIFLVGPTPREIDYVESWRPDALNALELLGFDGTVFLPEDPEWGLHDVVYGEQTRWEWLALRASACVACWMPRDLSLTPTGEMKMPAFTSNVEFGTMAVLKPERMVVGAPASAKKMAYLRQFCAEFHEVYFGKKLVIPVFDTLEATMAMAVEIATAGPRKAA
ncbi:hypothetical protein [Sphingomonas sp.]|uniref:hypothetical protein n=1 Tax=Sphingomonas sp. TaxID=28214 RepID=UPI000DB4C4D2|nr:hypothetical protein [Sphingomonas sp.]PZU05753.1 MAG: hypothetical protein DI605_21075 [Sphingomonas sp.]